MILPGPGWLAVAAAAAAGPVSAGRVCQLVPGEDCRALWEEYSAPGASVVTLAFDGDGYFLGAKASIASVITHASGPVLFAVASKTHAAAATKWFAGRDWPRHALCAVDPSGVPEVWQLAVELSGYEKPSHHQGWSSAPAALYRVFFNKLFPNIKRALYVDADVVVQTDVATALATLTEPMALPITAARSANQLMMRMEYCCNAIKKVAHLLQKKATFDAKTAAAENGSSDNTTGEAAVEAEDPGLDEADVKTLEEFATIPQSYREYNNGVMALDFPGLEEAGILAAVQRWLRLNLRVGFLNNDQHAWNLAGWQHWQDLQSTHATNAPSMDLSEAALKQEDPQAFVKERLRTLAFLHYTNSPKPWEITWTDMPAGALYDDRIFVDSLEAAGDSIAELKGISPDIRVVPVGATKQLFLRPKASVDEHIEYGLLYMEGSGGMGKDFEEAKWRFQQAAQGGDAPVAVFMRDFGLTFEQDLSDVERLKRLQACWRLSRRRVQEHEDHIILMQVYKQSEAQYLARKAPAMVAQCYWRVQSEDIKRPKDVTAEQMEALFSPNDGWKVPPLTPRQQVWLGSIAEDEAKEQAERAARGEETADGSAPTKLPQPALIPEGYERFLIFPALALLFGSGGLFLWRLGGHVDQRNSKANRNKKKKA